MPLSIASKATEKVTVLSAPKTQSGADGKLDGALRVTVLSGDATVEQDAALPLQFKAVAGAAGVQSVFSVQGDRDLGPGEDLIGDTVTYDVAADLVTDLGLSAGPVEPK